MLAVLRAFWLFALGARLGTCEDASPLAACPPSSERAEGHGEAAPSCAVDSPLNEVQSLMQLHRASRMEVGRGASRPSRRSGDCAIGDTVQCPGSGAMCAGDQCCPGVSGGPTFPCPSASQSFKNCGTPAKVESCLLTSDSYDVIVVGSGLVGSLVASKVAAKLPDKKVLLIEAGAEQFGLPGKNVITGSDVEADNGTNSKAPAYWSWSDSSYHAWPGYWNSTVNSRYTVPGNYGVMHCWGYSEGCKDMVWNSSYTAGQYQVKILGGGGSVNGALTQLPHDGMFEGGPYSGWPAWPAGWDAQAMEPYYQKFEEDFTWTPTPSTNGKHYLDSAGGNQLAELLASPCSAPGCPYPQGMHRAPTRKPRNGTFGIPMVTAYNGFRQSTATEYLPEAMKLPNFELSLNSEVTEVLKDTSTKQKATGVRYMRQGVERKAHLAAGGLLVMSAGAINTPRLLLQSGITNEGMGKNLSDHPMTSFAWRVSPSLNMTTFSAAPASNTDIAWYMSFHSGPLAQYGPVMTGYIRNPATAGSEADFDVEVFVNPAAEKDKLQIWFVLMRPTCYNAQLYMGEKGLEIDVDPRCELDWQTLQYARDTVQEHLLSLDKDAECYDNCGPVTEARIDAANHWVGTCALGRCVSPETLRVHGTDNVAVADASLLPGQVWAHPAMTLTAVGLRSAEILAASLA